MRVRSTHFGAAAIVAALTLLAAAPCAAAYYVGGGKGVKLAVRVVDRQIVWAKLSVRERCYSSRRGYYERTDAFQSMIEPVPIGSTGNFKWAYEDRRNPKKGSGSVDV